MNKFEDQMIDAVREGRFEEVRQLVFRHGLSQSPKWSGGYTLLCEAIKNNHVSVIYYLLRCGAKLNNGNIDAGIPLHLAVRKNYLKLAEHLLKKGAHLEATDSSGCTAFHVAIESGYQEVIELLLDRKANVNAKAVDGTTPLHIALKQEYSMIAKLLLEYGADINARDKEGKTPLLLAVEKAFALLVEEMLLRHKPDVSDNSALRAAVIGDAEDYGVIVDSLIEHGFTFNRGDIADSELFYTVVKKGYSKLVECLLKLGADPNFYNGCTLLCIAIRSEYEEIVTIFLRHGADPNVDCSLGHRSIESTDKAGILRLVVANTFVTLAKPELLHHFVQRKWLEGCKILLEHGHDVNGRSTSTLGHSTDSGIGVTICQEILIYYHTLYRPQTLETIAEFRFSVIEYTGIGSGLTPLHIATIVGSEEIVSILIEYAADIDAVTEDNFTPLHYAVQLRRQKIIDVLLEKGANVNAVGGENGSTPLHIAIDENYSEILGTLLENGADVNLSFEGEFKPSRIFQKGLVLNGGRCQGFTPLILAILKGRHEIVSVLLKKGTDLNTTIEWGRCLCVSPH